MSLFLHYLRKEFRFNWALALFAVAFQLLRLVAVLGLAGIPSGGGALGYAPTMVHGMAGYSLYTVAFILVGTVLGAESPVFKESFVATRPVRSWELGLAKVVAYLSILVIPVMLIEAIYLIAVGLSAQDIFWGLMQGGSFADGFLLAGNWIVLVVPNKKGATDRFGGAYGDNNRSFGSRGLDRAFYPRKECCSAAGYDF